MSVKPQQRDDLNMLEPEGVGRKTQEALKAVVPSSPLFREDELPLPPLPPSPVLTTEASQAFPSLRPLQKGIWWA